MQTEHITPTTLITKLTLISLLPGVLQWVASIETRLGLQEHIQS
jgi:hypothetical protein